MDFRHGLVSVIIPTYNRAPLVVDAIKSAQLQTYSNIEIIVIDDGSEDDTESAVQRLAGSDGRISFDRLETNKGHPFAMNRGLELAQGEYVQFLDSDDLIHNEKLRVSVDALIENPEIDLAIGQTLFFHKEPGDTGILYGTFKGEQNWMRRFLRHENVWIMISPVWRRVSLDRFGWLDKRLKCNLDYELFARCLILGAKVKTLPHVLAFYRRHDGPGIAQLDMGIRAKNLFGVFKHLLELLKGTSLLDDEISHDMSVNFWWIAGRLCGQTIYDEAKEAAEISFDLEPDPVLKAKIRELHDSIGDPVATVQALDELGYEKSLREQWFYRYVMQDEPIQPVPPARRYRRDRAAQA